MRLTDSKDRWLLRNKPDGFAIDVGCGNGSVTKGLGVNAGLDLSASNCAKARAKGIDVVRGEACSLPFRAEICECVVMTEVLEHLERPYEALREAGRILRRGGILLVTTPNCGSILWSTAHSEEHLVGFTLSILKNGISRVGFKVESCWTDKVTFLYPQRFFKKLFGPGGPKFMTERLALTPLGWFGDQICCRARRI
jgi:ubiquinone/menaquinone biosynthesis C-methylase UbiE